MRFLYSLLTLLLSSAMLQAQSFIRVMTFNIRYDNPNDSPNHWQARKEKVAAQILFHEADVIGVQEALHHQVNDLKHQLAGFGFVGVGRDDGQTKGEYSGILFKESRLQLLESKTFWLSTTPEVAGSKGWDAAITRIVTWAKFKDKRTGKAFFHFNTHFDHMGQEARRQSAHLLLEKVQSIAGKVPAFVTGDFNASPQDEPIRVITNAGNPLFLTDSKSVSAKPHYGPTGTFNGFDRKEKDNEPIDYIFIKGNWKVLQHATISQTWQGLFASDHFAVLADLQLL